MVLIFVIVSGCLVLVILAVLSLILSQNTTRLNRTPPAWETKPPVELSFAEKQHLLSLIQDGRKLEAVKQYKFLIGCNLKTAKNQVDRLESESRFSRS